MILFIETGGCRCLLCLTVLNVTVKSGGNFKDKCNSRPNETYMWCLHRMTHLKKTVFTLLNQLFPRNSFVYWNRQGAFVASLIFTWQPILSGFYWINAHCTMAKELHIFGCHVTDLKDWLGHWLTLWQFALYTHRMIVSLCFIFQIESVRCESNKNGQQQNKIFVTNPIRVLSVSVFTQLKMLLWA